VDAPVVLSKRRGKKTGFQTCSEDQKHQSTGIKDFDLEEGGEDLRARRRCYLDHKNKRREYIPLRLRTCKNARGNSFQRRLGQNIPEKKE